MLSSQMSEVAATSVCSMGAAHCPPLDLQSTKPIKMLMGARIAVPGGRTDFVILRSDYRCMLRRKELVNWVDHHKVKVLCNSKLNAVRALENESAREDASQASLNTVLGGVTRASNEAWGPWNEAPRKKSESGMAWESTHVNDDAIAVSMRVSDQVFAAQKAGSDKQAADITNEATSRKQTLEERSNGQDADTANDAPQKSVEEAFGMLKEQVEADRRIQLASKQGMEADGITDTSKPLKRSKILAKQVISQSSARAIGYVSQLWVSARLCKVIALEVRPSLLSSEIDRVFLGDICQIGDVVLVNDESALENETTALDCETLVGYDVVTEDGKYVGKIRDYSFDLDDGKLTSLDFDSVGFSLVPSSLISTYRLDVEEVIEVLPDSILVKDGAESRIRRLSKGFWQLPLAGDKRRSQKMARSRMLKKNLAEGDDIVSMSRQLPPNMRPRFFEGAELEGLDERADPAERRSLPRDYGGAPPRYRSR